MHTDKNTGNACQHSMQIAIALVCVISASLCSASASASFDQGHEFAMIASLTAAGPIAGWIMTIHDHKVTEGIGLLLPSTAIAFASIAFYIRSHSSIALVFAATWWWASGYLFAVAIWI